MTTPFGHLEWRRAAQERPAHSDGGFTLVELILVIAVLGIIGAGAILLFTGVTTEAAETGCRADRHALDVAVGAYEAQTHQRTIAPSGTDHDRYERALVEGGFLRDVSSMHDLGADGAITPEADSSC